MRHAERRFERLGGVCMIALSLCTAIRASDDALACVKQMAIPSAYSMVATRIPATVQVQVKIGEKGTAENVSYDNQEVAFKLLLNGYFKEKTKYLDSCKGKTITFTIHYMSIGAPVDFPISEVRFDPPDQFFVMYHSLKPALDPVRPK